MAVDDQSLTLTSSSGFPQSGRIKIDSEVMTYAAVSGNDLIGLTRGVNGTTAADALFFRRRHMCHIDCHGHQ
jgi:predicted lipid carrier protein YhbT